MDWKKFLTTEWIAFVMIFGVATWALFSRFATGSEWGIAVLGAAGELVAVRWHKKKVALLREGFNPTEET